MRESCTSGSVRGASSDRRLYSTLSIDGLVVAVDPVKSVMRVQMTRHAIWITDRVIAYFGASLTILWPPKKIASTNFGAEIRKVVSARAWALTPSTQMLGRGTLCRSGIGIHRAPSPPSKDPRTASFPWPRGALSVAEKWSANHEGHNLSLL
jgi:hypothetical protein